MFQYEENNLQKEKKSQTGKLVVVHNSHGLYFLFFLPIKFLFWNLLGEN